MARAPRTARTRRARHTPRPLLAAVALALTLAGCGGSSTDDTGGETAGMCAAEEPDCDDMIVTGDGDTGSDTDDSGAAGSCLAGDQDCTDESYGGQDVARPIPLSGSPSDAERIEPGPTSGATGRQVTAAHLAGDAVLELSFGGGACDLLEDVVVEESPGEVRVLVLSGMDASVDACTQQVVQWSTEVQLDAPLGDRQLLDLAG